MGSRSPKRKGQSWGLSGPSKSTGMLRRQSRLLFWHRCCFWHVHISTDFLYVLPVAVARSSSEALMATRDNSTIRYVLPVLWMTLCFHVLERMGQNQRRDVRFVYFAKWRGCEVCRLRLHPAIIIEIYYYYYYYYYYWNLWSWTVSWWSRLWCSADVGRDVTEQCLQGERWRLEGSAGDHLPLRLHQWRHLPAVRTPSGRSGLVTHGIFMGK